MRNIIYIAKQAASQLWTPPGAKLAHDNTTQYMQDMDAWVASSNFLPALRSRLRSYPLDEFLALVSRATFLKAGRAEDIAQYLNQQDWNQQTSLRVYQMAFLVRLALEDHAYQGQRAWPVDTDVEKFGLLHKCTKMASGVIDEADSPGKTKSPGHAWAILQRIANQQFGEFEPLKRFFPRAILLFGECARQEESKQGLTLNGVFQERTGLSIDEAMFLAFGIYSMLAEGKRGHILSKEIMTNSPHFPGITADKVEKLFDWLSVGYEEFMQEARNPRLAAREGYETYNLNPLVEHPIIQLLTGSYVVPIAHYLFHRVTTGLYYDLIRSSRRARVGNIIGRAIENYVERLIHDLPAFGNLIPEFEYQRGRWTSEWILDETDAVVVIECKRRALVQVAKSTGGREELRNALGMEGGVADGVVQLRETEQAIRSGLVPGVDAKKRVIGVLVTLDNFYNANFSDTRQLVREFVEERSAKGLGDLEYQICPIAQFEDVCRLIGGTRETLATFFSRKIDGVDNVIGDAPTGEWDCGQYVTHIWPKGLTGGIPSHDPAFDAFVRRTAVQFGGDPDAVARDPGHP